MTKKAIGKAGEDIAKKFLTNRGFEILEMNYHYSKMAEIDIIAKKDGICHFVEVKTRTQTAFGSPLEAITPKKLASIHSCALFYLKNSKEKFKSIQIDAIGIVLQNGKEAQISFIENISLN